MESKVFENLIKQPAGIASISEFLLDLLDLLNNLPPFLKGGRDSLVGTIGGREIVK